MEGRNLVEVNTQKQGESEPSSFGATWQTNVRFSISSLITTIMPSNKQKERAKDEREEEK